MSTPTAPADILLRPGLALEYMTLGSTVVATAAFLAAAVLPGATLTMGAAWWRAEPVSNLVILAHGLREARHAEAEAG